MKRTPYVLLLAAASLIGCAAPNADGEVNPPGGVPFGQRQTSPMPAPDVRVAPDPAVAPATPLLTTPRREFPAGREIPVAPPSGSPPGRPRTDAGREATPAALEAAAALAEDRAALATAAGFVSNVPEGARYTLFVRRFAGPTHVRTSQQARDRLTGVNGLTDWHVLHGEDESLLYHGHYRAIAAEEDEAAAAAAQRDRQAIARLVDGQGDPLFRQLLFVPLDAPDPAAPPQYDLARADGRWSLVIAGYTDHPDRKQAAVDAVVAARQQGVEAYYWHGPRTSHVAIGSWPEQAVFIRDPVATPAGREEGDEVLVSETPLPQAIREQAERADVKVVEPKLEPIDPSIVKAMQAYPTYAVNGMVQATRQPDGRGGTVESTQKSFLIDLNAIDRSAPSSSLGGTAPEEDQTPRLLLTPPDGRRGGLRSLD